MHRKKIKLLEEENKRLSTENEFIKKELELYKKLCGLKSQSKLNQKSPEQKNADLNLLWCVKEGDYLGKAHIQRLFEKENPHKPDLEVTDEVGDTPLFIALKNKKIDLVHQLINYGADLNHMVHGVSPLSLALRQSKLEEGESFWEFVIERLRGKGARRLDASPEEQKFEEALRLNKEFVELIKGKKAYPEIMRYMLTHNADLYPCGQENAKEQDIPICIAIQQQNSELLMGLIAEFKFDINQPLGVLKKTPLMHVATLLCENTDEQIVKIGLLMALLNKKGARPNEKDLHGDTALHWAARSNNMICAILLVKNGADASLVNNKGQTARELAEAAKSFNVVKLLTPEKQNDKNSKLFSAIFCKDLAEVKQTFADEPQPDLKARDCYAHTPILAAINKSEASIVEFLLSKKADPNEPHPRTKDYLLHHTISLFRVATSAKERNSLTKIAKLLVEAKADLKARGDRGNTPLHQAAYYGSQPLVEFLLKKDNGATTKTLKNDRGNTPYEEGIDGMARANEEIRALLKVPEEPKEYSYSSNERFSSYRRGY